MAHEIQKHKFKRGTDLQVEVVPLKSLVKANREHLVIPHRTNFYHIFLFENCRLTHSVDFEPINIKPYSLLFIDKDRVHQFDRSLKYEGCVIVFTDDFFCISDSDTKFLRSSILFNNPPDSSVLNLGKAGFEKFVTICDSITTELNLLPDKNKHLLLKNQLQNFLLLADREKRKAGFSEPRKGPDLDYTLSFKDMVGTAYRELKTVSDYSSQLHISEKRLAQATAKVLGKAPKEIINERILLEAKRLLVYTHLSVKEIGLDLGFNDPAYFVRYFKKNAQTTPVEFREKYTRQ
jgi:AraC-like DNA-binding protein